MIFYQRIPNQNLSKEALLVKQYGLMNGINCYPYTVIEQVSTKAIEGAELIQGSVESITSALQRIGISAPEPDYYPDVLRAFMGRRAWRTQYGLIADTEFPIFVKSHDWKALTGSIHTQRNMALSSELEVWCSDIVHFIAEWRVYVHHGKIVHVARYDENDDDDLSLDWKLVMQAIALLESTEIRASYAIDWGLTNTGKTVLVENNDGWAIGAYENMDYTVYTQFLCSRWDQLTQRIRG